MSIPMQVRIVLVPEEGATIDPPANWLDAARSGLATQAALDDLAAQVQAIVAGTNIVVTPDGEGVLRIHAMGGAASYRVATASGALLIEDNGRVVEVDSADAVTLTVPAGLPRGWTCLVRQVGAGGVTVAREPGVVFAPIDGDLTTDGAWQEVALESRGDGAVIARLLT